MWIVILCLIIYFLFNAVLTLICEEENGMKNSSKAIIAILGLPILIVLAVAIIVEKVRKR